MWVNYFWYYYKNLLNCMKICCCIQPLHPELLSQSLSFQLDFWLNLILFPWMLHLSFPLCSPVKAWFYIIVGIWKNSLDSHSRSPFYAPLFHINNMLHCVLHFNCCLHCYCPYLNSLFGHILVSHIWNHSLCCCLLQVQFHHFSCFLPLPPVQGFTFHTHLLLLQ